MSASKLEIETMAPSLSDGGRTDGIPVRSRAVSRDIRVQTSRTEHLGKHRQYWRDILLGVNDGLVSTFLLVAGVVGSGLSSTDILLTAISGALAGAVSMAAGEFVATKSQNEVLTGEIGLERKHILENKEDELAEVTKHLEIIGIPPEETELLDLLIHYYDNNSTAMLKLMVALEFGVVEDEQRTPLRAALFSGFLFVLGSLPSVLPFIPKSQSSYFGLWLSAGCTTVSLLLVGSIKTWATKGNCLYSALENLTIAGLGGLCAYFVGRLFDMIVH